MYVSITVRKRELAKGGFRNLEDDLSKPYQTTDVVSEPYPTQRYNIL